MALVFLKEALVTLPCHWMTSKMICIFHQSFIEQSVGTQTGGHR
jgi:hypothetical protein